MALRSGIKGFSSEMLFKVNCFVRIVWLVKETFGINVSLYLCLTMTRPKNNLNLFMTANGADATAYVWFLCQAFVNNNQILKGVCTEIFNLHFVMIQLHLGS